MKQQTAPVPWLRLSMQLGLSTGPAKFNDERLDLEKTSALYGMEMVS